MKDTLFVNLFGGPGVGKSQTAAGVFSMLKAHGVDCELATEFPKDAVWEERKVALANQHYIYGEQHHRHFRLQGRVDVVVSDSPILLTAVYATEPNLKLAAVKSFGGFSPSMNFVLRRMKPYNPNGRYQSEPEARKLDAEILDALSFAKADYVQVHGSPIAVNTISAAVLLRLGIPQAYVIRRK